MRTACAGILLALGALLPAPVGPVGAQSPSGCLRPLGAVQSGASPLPDSAPILRAPGRPGGSFVSSEGYLCGLLLPPDRSKGGQLAEPPTVGSGRAFLYSLTLPGGGQWILGQGRWTAYVAGEIWAWIQYLEGRREGRALQRKYKDLAWYVARRVSSGHRVDGNFEYYEAMTLYRASGAYDRDPFVSGVQPETDSGTFNGSIWALAQEIFFPEDPTVPVDESSDPYNQALRYYLSRAYQPYLAWNWGENDLHQLEFSDLIRSSDENLRRSTTMIGVILANHLLSSVDAFISARLRAQGDQEDPLDLAAFRGPRGALGFSLRLYFPLPLDQR